MGKINKDLLNSVNHGDVKSLKTLINRHGLHNSVAHGYILLLKSIKLKNNKITELLLNEGSRVNRKRTKRIPSNTPLHLAIENGDLKLTEMLLDNGADITANNVNGLSPLVLAIIKKKEEIIYLIIRKRRDCINDRCKQGICPLHAAAEHGSSNITQKLLQNGAIVDVKTTSEWTPLQFASQKGNLNIIELLLNSKANINPRTHHTWAPLYLAVDNCHRDAAQFLMIRGAKINNEFKNGKTVLSCAIEKCLWLVEDILKYSPDINNASNKKSFKFAARQKDEFYFPIVKSLIRYGFSIEASDINDTALLRNAVKMGYIEIIQDLIKHGLDLTHNKSTFLLIAVKNKQLEIAELFVTHGADVNSTNNAGKPLIFYSVQNSDVKMYKLLVQHGADANEYPELLRLAIKGECKEIFDHLLENKVDIDAADEYGRTPLHFTVSRILSYDKNFPKTNAELDEAIGEYNSYQPNIKIRTEIAKILLDKGANIHAKTYLDRSTALHIACEEGFANLVEILLEYQADINCLNVDGTPLHCAARNRDDNKCIIEMLLAKKANINSRNGNGDTALHITVENNNTNIAQTLVKNGADIDSKNNMYVTPLHKAITYNSFGAIYILLEHGCSINSKDIYGNTPLHQAIISGNCLLKRLLEFGSDINILNNNNQTPVDVAYDRVEKNERYFEGDDGYYGYYEDLQYEPDESYEDNRDMKNFKKLLLHAIMLKAANLYYGEIDLYSYSYLRDKNFMKLHEEKCTKEIIQLKLEKIAGTKFSFYDILTKNTQSSVSFARNEDVDLIFQSDDYRKKFPIYASMLKRNFKKATQRCRLLETAHEFFKCLNFEIPYGCADQIINYLSDSDLQNLFKLMEMPSTLKTCKSKHSTLLPMGKINKDLLYSVNHGDVKSLKTLINRHGLHNSVAHGYILLLKSIKLKNNEITEILLSEGSRVNRKRNKRIPSNTPLHLAIENGDLKITEMLLDNGADIDADNKKGYSPLILAIIKNNEEIIDLLIRKKANLNYICIKGLSALYAAVHYGLCQLTEKLLQNGAYANLISTNSSGSGFTPLHYATFNGNIAIIKVLLKYGAIVDVKTENGYTPLHFACEKGNVEIIELLLTKNVDINSLNYDAMTPLYIAVHNSHRDAAKCLMNHGAEINEKFDNVTTVLSCAVQKGLSLIVEDILEYRPDIKSKVNKKSFIKAASKPNEHYSPIVKNLIRYGFSVDASDINNSDLVSNTIKMGYIEIIQDLIKHGLNKEKYLCSAAMQEQLEVAEFFVTNGADVNAIDYFGKPPIVYSIKNSDLDMSKLLLLHGANVEEYPELLSIVIELEWKEILEMLLERRVDIEATDGFGRTPLHLTISHKYSKYDKFINDYNDEELNYAHAYLLAYPPNIEVRTEMAKILLAKGANVHAETIMDSATPLHIACEEGFASIIEVLLEYQADVNYLSVDGTPFHIAATNDNEFVIEMLLANKANIDLKNRYGNTALHIATECDSKNVLKTLLKNGANVNSRDKKGRTPFQLALENKNLGTFAIFLDYLGSSIDSKDIDDNTPLHKAIMLADRSIIESLLNLGSNINILNNNNHTPIDLADHLHFSQLSCISKCKNTVYSHDLYNANNIDTSKILLLHAIMLKAANLYYGKKDLYSYLADNDFMKSHEEKCTKEIVQLKRFKVASKEHSFYDILTKSVHSTASFVKNEDVIRILESDHYKDKFPIYVSMLKRNLEKATQRCPLLEKAHEFFKSYFKTPYECTDRILSYLSNEDLQNFVM
ncbi:uncharacterized protein LOC129913682 [Episyrphus balteatus]|uniref:uncharacterized protein LOC129913682 n=1 Tax=Episyrphus balteatus TaxID=286459 RepID=UPI0024853F4B|nr:uncharacterized protein LOC129913682 [Episyrphus balteatus]